MTQHHSHLDGFDYQYPRQLGFRQMIREKSIAGLAMLGIFGMLANEMMGVDPLTGGAPTPHIF